MADMKLISKLFATEPVKYPTVGNLGATAPAEPSMHELFARSLAQPLHRRFLTPRRSRHDSPALMSSVPPGVPVDRNGAFADLAARDRAFRRVARGSGPRHVERGAEPAPPSRSRGWRFSFDEFALPREMAGRFGGANAALVGPRQAPVFL